MDGEVMDVREWMSKCPRITPTEGGYYIADSIREGVPSLSLRIVYIGTNGDMVEMGCDLGFDSENYYIVKKVEFDIPKYDYVSAQKLIAEREVK